MRLRSLAGIAGIGLVATGCYTTTIRSGRAPAPAPTIEYDEKWHSGVIVGIAELSGPYKLTEVCPGGWAEIRTETSFINGFVDLITSGIYNPQSVTVICAAVPPPPPSAAQPLAPPTGAVAPAGVAAPPAPTAAPAPVPAPAAEPPATGPGGAVYAPEPPPIQ